MQGRIVRLLIIAVAASALRARVVVRPAAPIVPAGTSLRFEANGPVKWSLEPGSAGSIDPDGTYHAPASVPVKNKDGGCQILPSDHIFNTRVDSLPVDSKSPYYMSLIPPTPVGYYEAWGSNIANRSTPKKRMHFLYTEGNDGSYEMVQWPELNREGGVFSDPHSDIDRHEIAVDRDSCRVFEFYNIYEAGSNPSCPTCTAQSGFQYGGMDAGLPQGSVDAAGLLLTPLTLRLADVRSGAIQHALRVTLKNSIISPTSIWPARSHAGAWGHIPYGTRFRLKSSYDISRFSPLAKVLLAQLKEYGFILADGGANWEVDTSTDVTEDPDVMAAFDEISKRGPRSSEFEVVNESSLMTSPDSGLVNPGNGYVKLDSFAIVVATDAHNPEKSTRVRVLLQGITVGVSQPSVWIQSGVSKRFPSWVNGTKNQNVTWELDPKLGTVSPDGTYTAPQVSRPAHAMLTVSSAADPSAKATIALTVMPPGTIRIKVGNATGAPGAPNHFAPDYGPDAEGQMWWRGQAGEVSWGVIEDDWYAEKWPPQKDIQLYYTSRYSFGDMIYRFFVPNGKYKITLLFAQPIDHQNTPYPKDYRAPIHLEAQGKLLVRDYDMGAGIGYARGTPVMESLPAVVTDNSLYFALRRVTLPGDSRPSPLLNGFSIARDDAPPHISIAPEKISSVNISEQIQFKVIGWSMPDAVTWSVAKGPGSITSSGLYTGPSEPPAKEEAVVVEAKSITDPSKIATAEAMFKAGELAISPGSIAVARSLTQQFKASIEGAPYSNVAWSLSPQVGTINAEGLFTAPEKLSVDTKVTVRAQSKTNGSEAATASMIVKVLPDPIRIDCGEGSFKDAKGRLWAQDYGYSGQTVKYSVNVPILHAPPDMLPLYQSSRYVYDNGKFSYNFPLPNGKYRVTLMFSDYGFDTPGHHYFDVKLNGRQVLTNFDPNAEYGTRAAIDKQFEVTVDDKALHIDFIGHKGGALINGIEIVPIAE